MANGPGLPGKGTVKYEPKAEIPDFSLTSSGEPSPAWRAAQPPEPVAPHPTDNLSLRQARETGQPPLFDPEVKRKRPVLPKDVARAAVDQGGRPAEEVAPPAETQAKQSRKRQEESEHAEAAKTEEQKSEEAAAKNVTVPEEKWVDAFGDTHGERIHRALSGETYPEIAADHGVREDAVRKSVARATSESIDKAVSAGKIDALTGADMKRQLETAQKGAVVRKTAAEANKEGGSTVGVHQDLGEGEVKEIVSHEGTNVVSSPKPDANAGKLKPKEAVIAKDAAFWEEQRKANAGPKGDGAKYDEAVAKLKELAQRWGKPDRRAPTDEERLAELESQIAKATKKDGFAPKKLVEKRDALREKLDLDGHEAVEDGGNESGVRWEEEKVDPNEQASKGGEPSIDQTDSERMDKDLRKLQDKGDFREVIKFAIGNETNPIRKRILEMVLARHDDLKKLGFDFSFRVTKPNHELPGMAGVSRHFPGELGKATRMEVILNGADNGRAAGTNQETLAHELIHSVTQAAISANPDGTAARKLQSFYSELRKDILDRKAKGELNDYEKKFFFGANNSLENAHELLAWGLTNEKMQNYLAERMDPQGRTWYSRLLDVVARALGIHKLDERSDLARLIAVSDEMMHEDLTPYVDAANKSLLSFGKQAHEGEHSLFALRNKRAGMEIAYDKDGLVLYRAKDLKGREIFVPGKEGVGVANRDVSKFTSHEIPAADIAKLRAVADTLRSTESAMIQKNIAKLPERYQEPVRDATDAISRWGSQALNHVTFTRDLVKKGIAMGMHSLEKFEKLRESQEAMSGKFRKMAIDAIEDVKNFHQPEKQALTDFLQHSTLNKEWGYGPKARGKAQEMYDALTPRAQKVARQVFDHGAEMLKAKKEAINKLADDTYGHMIDEAKAAGNARLADEIAADRATMVSKYASLMNIGEGDPYTSARRQGDWVVVGKSDKFLHAERDAANESDPALAKAGQDARMKMIDDPKHYMVHEAESPSEARALVKNMQEKLGFPEGVDNTYYHPKDPWKAKLDGGQGVLAGMARLRGQLDDLYGSARTPEDKAKYETSRKLLTNMWLDALGTASARKSELRRLGISGQMDMIKAFRLQSTADAHFVSGIYHNAKMLDALKAANKEANASGVSSEERTARMGLYDEFMRRHDLSMNAPPTPVFNKIAQYTALWQIATSPGHYLGNLMQPWAMTLPYLQARHGYAKSAGEFFKAYGEIGDILAKTGVLSSLKVSDMPADVRDAMARLLELGRLDIGMNTEYGSLELKEKGVVSKAMQGVVDRIRQASLKMESLNRLASAAAAYRLEMERTGDHEHSLHYAADVVAETHGDYSASNAPRMFNSGLGKMALQFRKFQLVQLTYMAKLIGELKDADPETRQMAQRALAFTLGHVAVLGGALAMPGFGTLSAASQNLTKMATGIEGEDLETKLEKMVGDRNVAQLLLRGVPGLAGVDLTKKVGFGDMAAIMPMSDVDPTKSTSVKEGLGDVLSGPFGGLLERGATALGNMQRGNWYRGLEGLAPEGVMNVMKAARTSGALESFGVKGGVTNTKGDKLMDVSAANAFVQALGFTPSAQALQSSETGAMAKSTEAFKDRLDVLKAQYTNVARDGGDVSAVVKKLNALRTEMIDRGFKPTPLGAILKAPVEQLKREMFTTAGGVQYQPKQTGRAVAELPK